MPTRKRLNAGGQWADIGQEVLKTDVTMRFLEEPETIEAGTIPFVFSETLAEYDTHRTSYARSTVYLTIPRNGIYNFKSSIAHDAGTATFYGKIMKNGTTQCGNEVTLNSSTRFGELSANNISCAEGDEISIYVKSSSTSGDEYVGMLVGYIKWDKEGS